MDFIVENFGAICITIIIVAIFISVFAAILPDLSSSVGIFVKSLIG